MLQLGPIFRRGQGSTLTSEPSFTCRYLEVRISLCEEEF